MRTLINVYIFIAILFCSFAQKSYSQSIEDYDVIFQNAISAVERDDIETVIREYRNLANVIKGQIDSGIDVSHIMPYTLTNYIINKSSKLDHTEANKYILEVLDLYIENLYSPITSQEVIDNHYVYINQFIERLEIDEQCDYICWFADALIDNNYTDKVLDFCNSHKHRYKENRNYKIIERINTYCSDFLCWYGYYDLYKEHIAELWNEIVEQGPKVQYIDIEYRLLDLLTLLGYLHSIHINYIDDNYDEKSIKNCISAVEIILAENTSDLSHDIKAYAYTYLGDHALELCDYLKGEEYINKATNLLNDVDAFSARSIEMTAARLYLAKRDIIAAQGLFEKLYKEYDIYGNPRELPYLLYYLRQCAVLSGDTEANYNYSKLWYETLLCDYLSSSWSKCKSDRLYSWLYYASQNLYYGLERIAPSAFLSDSLAVLAYDVSLVQKGFPNKYDKLVRENVYNTNDSTLINAYVTYSNAMVNNSDSLSVYEHELQKYYIKHPEFIDSFKLDTYSDVQFALNENEVAIEFAEACPHLDSLDSAFNGGEGAYYIALILHKSGGPIPIKLGSSKQIEELIKKKHRLYQNENSQQAYSVIWGKIEPYIFDAETIYFSPYSSLNCINLEVLQDNNGIEFGQKFNVHRVSSTSDICKIKNGKVHYNKAVLFGGLTFANEHNQKIPNVSRNVRKLIKRYGWMYLEGSRREINNISKIIEDKINTQLYTDFAGSESTFKSLSYEAPDILHIATHGFYFTYEETQGIQYYQTNYNVDEYLPAMKRAGLVFSGGHDSWNKPTSNTNNDGILTAEEISGMNLENVDLLVLSACQTGCGLATSEGIIGLPKAFKLAGVNTIIMSLWDVDDMATEMMMTTFYKNLFEGYSKKEAFTKAINDVKEWNSNPYYWAAFIMLE